MQYCDSQEKLGVGFSQPSLSPYRGNKTQTLSSFDRLLSETKTILSQCSSPKHGVPLLSPTSGVSENLQVPTQKLSRNIRQGTMLPYDYKKPAAKKFVFTREKSPAGSITNNSFYHYSQYGPPKKQCTYTDLNVLI